MPGFLLPFAKEFPEVKFRPLLIVALFCVAESATAPMSGLLPAAPRSKPNTKESPLSAHVFEWIDTA